MGWGGGCYTHLLDGRLCFRDNLRKHYYFKKAFEWLVRKYEVLSSPFALLSLLNGRGRVL